MTETTVKANPMHDYRIERFVEAGFTPKEAEQLTEAEVNWREARSSSTMAAVTRWRFGSYCKEFS